MNDLVTHVNGRAVDGKRTFDNRNRAGDARTKTAGLGKNDLHGSGCSVNLSVGESVEEKRRRLTNAQARDSVECALRGEGALCKWSARGGLLFCLRNQRFGRGGFLSYNHRLSVFALTPGYRRGVKRF